MGRWGGKPAKASQSYAMCTPCVAVAVLHGNNIQEDRSELTKAIQASPEMHPSGDETSSVTYDAKQVMPCHLQSKRWVPS